MCQTPESIDFNDISCVFFSFCVASTVATKSDCGDGEIRIAGGLSSHEGRVEVCLNQAWGTVCDRSWSTEDSNVVCGQLGFLPLGTFVAVVVVVLLLLLLYVCGVFFPMHVNVEGV